MGSGLSMASVNKIKELAEQREYSLALDIVDSQDLSKSLNPQFLRVCGEIYINNERYKDARRVLLMAHKLAPEGKRVIYSLTYLYLKMGYKKLAEKYYNLYLFDADEFNPETNQIKYIFNKANMCEPEELEEFLCPQYIHNLDYDWSFETFLLLAILDKKQDMNILASDFIATYKNSEYSKCIENIRSGKASAKDYYYVFPEEKRADDDPEQEELRKEEKILLEADDLRVNPREAEITIMVDDFEEVDIGTQRRLKKFLKNEEKVKKKEKKKELSEDSEGEENDSEATELESPSDGENQENAATEEATTEEDSKEDNDKKVSENGESEDVSVEKKKVKGLFKKVFSKKKKQSDESEEETKETETVSETEKIESEDNIQEEKTEETSDNDSEETFVEEEKTDTDVSEDENADEVSGTEGQMVDTSVDVAEDSPKEEEEVLMQEIHTNKHNPKVSIDFDDNDFAAESDTIEGLKDEDFSNPFDSISAFKKEKEEPTFVPKRKTEFSFDDIDLSTDEDEEFEVDDFSSDEDEFGKMEVELEDSEEYTEEAIEAEIKVEEIKESEVDEIEEESNAEEVRVEVDDETEVEVPCDEECSEIEESEDYEEEYSEESIEVESVETEPEVEEIKESEVDEIEEESEAEEVQVEAEDEAEIEETYDEEYSEIEETKDYAEEYYEGATEVEPEVEEIEESEVEEIDEESEVKETKDEPEVEEIEEIEEEIPDEPEVRYDYIPETPKKTLDYPVFRSSLFPNHNKEVKQVENNFNEIMAKGQDKMQENLLKEEQMQREAEALLASLGIDLSSITVTSDSIDSINSTLYNEPSRDELKASLKIDSVKKNILKQLKEYR